MPGEASHSDEQHQKQSSCPHRTAGGTRCHVPVFMRLQSTNVMCCSHFDGCSALPVPSQISRFTVTVDRITNDCLENIKIKLNVDLIVELQGYILKIWSKSNLTLHDCAEPDLLWCFCCYSFTGSWSNVEQSIVKVTEGLGSVPSQTLRIKLEESLSLVKGSVFQTHFI